ncbi:hypothetical protein K474DRAFT_1450268 [Panus rudis PR-1116 ss-1]|nr:hypothetical protein K474DRAFT_1450268 [Panus rudis PR-1116 ss-1]
MRCSFLTAFVVLAAAHNSVFVTASPIVASDSSGSDVTFCPCRYGGGPIVRPMPLGSDVRKRFISTDGSDDVRGRINETLDRLLSKLHQSDGSGTFIFVLILATVNSFGNLAHRSLQ